MRAPHLPKDAPHGASPRHPMLAPLIVSSVIALLAGATAGIAVSSRAFDRALYGVDREYAARSSAPRRLTSAESLLAAKKVSPAVVEIVRKPGTLPASHGSLEVRGTGFFVSTDGWIATHASALLDRASLAAATAEGQILPVRESVRDPASDLVFLRVDGDNFPVLPFDESPVLGPGALARVGLSSSRVRPVAVADALHALDREAAGALPAERIHYGFLIFETLPLASRGAPVVTGEGAVAGMVVSSGDGGAKVLPARAFSRAIRNVLKGEKISRAFLGVAFRDPHSLYRATARKEAPGVAVESVQSGAPAARAGIKAGDVLISFDGEQVSSVRPLSSLLAEYAPGDRVKIKFRRGEEERETEVTLGEMKR